MNTSKSGAWIAGTAFISALILLAAWFLVASPTLAEAGDARAQATAQRDQNELTRSRLVELKAQFANLDGLKGELAALQLQIPTTYDLANYQRQLASIAAAHSVTITSLQVSPAVAVVPLLTAADIAAQVAADSAAAAAASAASESGDSADDAAVAVAPTPGVEGMNALNVSLDVVGSYSNMLAFLQDLQAGTDRVLLVGALTGTASKPAVASGGIPAIETGDLTVLVTGSVYVLADPVAAGLADPSTAELAPVLPVPEGADNPLLPLR